MPTASSTEGSSSSSPDPIPPQSPPSEIPDEEPAHDNEDSLSRQITPGRALTTVSSSATLCHYSSDDEECSRHKTKESIDHPPTIDEVPAQTLQPPPTLAARQGPTPPRIPSPGTAARHDAPPPIPPPDLVAYFDPASAGGGGPLRRITTQQRERAEAEARDRAERAHREAMGLPPVEVAGSSTAAGIMNRLRSGSTASRRKPRFVTPLLHHEEETQSRTSNVGFRPTLSTTWSQQTLTSEDGKKERDLIPLDPPPDPESASEVEYVYPDGGYGWVIIACCMILAACTMGQGMNYGAYQSYYMNTVFPGVSSGYIGIIGTSSAFFMNGAAFFFGRMGDRYGYKLILYISAFVAWLGLFLASFCTQPWQLLLTQGMIAGIGQGAALPLFMSLPSQWFYRKRGLASGMALSGAGIGGGTSLLVIQKLLTTVGYKKTLLIMSFINAFWSLLAIILIKTRPASPEAAGGGRGPWVDKNVVKTSGFWSISLSLVVATMGYGSPWLFLQKWVESNIPGTEDVLAALPATLLSFCLTFGRSMIGAVADAIGPLNACILVFALSAVIQSALWLTATTYAQVCAFSIIYGLVAPGFLGLVPQMVVQLFGPSNLASNVGLLILFNGPGNMAGGPLSGAIYDAGGRTTFKWVIIVNSIFQGSGAIIACWARFKASKRVLAKV